LAKKIEKELEKENRSLKYLIQLKTSKEESSPSLTQPNPGLTPPNSTPSTPPSPPPVLTSCPTAVTQVPRVDDHRRAGRPSCLPHHEQAQGVDVPEIPTQALGIRTEYGNVG